MPGSQRRSDRDHVDHHPRSRQPALQRARRAGEETRRLIEEEARQILQRALAAPDDLGAAIRSRFQPLGGVELDLPSREPRPDRRTRMS